MVLSDPTFAVVVPMCNEERNARACVEAVAAALGALDARARWFVVDDGSRDATAAIVGAHAGVTLIRHDRNRGYGRALVTGGRAAFDAGFDYVVFMDSDLTNDPAFVAQFIPKMREGFDCIKASRYVAGGGMRGVPLYRRVISRAGNFIARALMRLPIHDLTNGFRAVKTSAFVRIPFEEKGFAIIMEELFHLKRMGCTFAEVANVLGDREGATSFSYKPATFARYLKYPLKSFLRK